MRLKVILCLLFCFTASSLRGQSTTGAILGDVLDSSNARLPGAAVRLLNEGTGATRDTLTNEVGSFRFDALQPVDYTVTIEFAGFNKVTRQHIHVPVASEVK